MHSTYSNLWDVAVAVAVAGRQFWKVLQNLDGRDWTGHNLYFVAFVNTGMTLGSTTGGKIILIL
jgi:hypothetical protein